MPGMDVVGRHMVRFLVLSLVSSLTLTSYRIIGSVPITSKTLLARRSHQNFHRSPLHRPLRRPWQTLREGYCPACAQSQP
ncbi:hypothetical protein BKA70DRAFT_345142 [Coprinopsis sp. MPI-PUGE-AT-0042]|nr:hypothetical protein BKA70DRAFT_345142 [Coprinopsis sp. MPI-PUGE-AT-0042]